MARYEWLLLLVLVLLSLFTRASPVRGPRPPEPSASAAASQSDEPEARAAVSFSLSLGVSDSDALSDSDSDSEPRPSAPLADRLPNLNQSRSGSGSGDASNSSRRHVARSRAVRSAIAPANASDSTSPPSGFELAVTTPPAEPIEVVEKMYRTPPSKMHSSKRAPHTLQLNVGTIYPMTGDWNGGVGCKPSIEMAVDDINSRNDVLDGYELVLHTRDDQVCV